MVLAVGCIVVVELCERVGLNTLVSTMKSWLQDQGMSNAASSSVHQIFTLLSFTCCFFGGVLAEAYLGRYKTISIFAIIYAAGCGLAAAAASTENLSLFLVGILLLVAPGTGGIKPNISPFGADQIDPLVSDFEQKRESFFMYLYLTVNLGCVIAFGFLANVATGGLPPLVPKEDGFFAAYTVMAILMAVALLVYLGGTPCYTKTSLEKNTASVVWPAFQRLLSGRHSSMGKLALLGWALLPTLILLSVLQVFFPLRLMTIVSLLVDLLCIGCLCVAHRNNSWLGEPDGVTRCLDVVPMIIVGNVTFNVLYNTMFSLFYSQACQMDTRIGGRGMQLSGAFFNLGSSFAVIIFTPLLERLILPAAEKMLGPVSSRMKVLFGISLAISSQIVAAGLELQRRNARVLSIPSNCAPLLPDGEHVHMSAMSAFWMFLPYALVGAGEALVNPVLQHVAYSGADPSLRSLMQALCLFAMGGLPNAISAAMTEAMQSFTPNDLNQGRMPLVYLVNVIFCVAGCIIFSIVARTSDKSDKWGCLEHDSSSEDSASDIS